MLGSVMACVCCSVSAQNPVSAPAPHTHLLNHGFWVVWIPGPDQCWGQERRGWWRVTVWAPLLLVYPSPLLVLLSPSTQMPEPCMQTSAFSLHLQPRAILTSGPNTPLHHVLMPLHLPYPRKETTFAHFENKGHEIREAFMEEAANEQALKARCDFCRKGWREEALH